MKMKIKEDMIWINPSHKERERIAVKSPFHQQRYWHATCLTLLTFAVTLIGFLTWQDASSVAHNALPFAYRHQPANICPAAEHIFLLVLIHSKADHFRQRQSLRQTWASVHQVNNQQVRWAFLLGKPAIQTSPLLMEEQSLIAAESGKYGDIIQGEFADTYRNLTYKNLLGLQWLQEHCLHAQYVLKMDDDAYMDPYQIIPYLERTFGLFAPSQAFMCSVQPAGQLVQRNSGDKWFLSVEEYPVPKFPRFCGGLAYFLSPSLAQKLYRKAVSLPDSQWLWIDDVFVTGLLAQQVGAKHFYLNTRYTYNQSDLDNWLDSDSTDKSVLLPSSCPYMIAEMDTKTTDDWKPMADQLWKKTLLAHNI